jgi:hypothetical protein
MGGDAYGLWSPDSTEIVYIDLRGQLMVLTLEFSYPVFDKWIIDIVIPDGYEVDSLPVSQKVGTENDRIVYTYRAGVSQGKVQLVLDIGVQHLQYDPHEYEVLKTLYDRLATATRERVVLKKL